MTAIERLADELCRAFDGDAWHGPSLMAQLADLAPEEATARPIPGAHTAAELVAHLAVWQDVARRRIEGERPRVTPDEDWPPATAWPAALDALGRSHRALLAAVGGLTDADLDRPMPREGEGEPYPLAVMLHGIAQHAAYHAGQAALLRRALRAVPA